MVRTYWPLACLALFLTVTLAGCTAPTSDDGADGDAPEFTIVMRNTQYDPVTLTVPVGAKVTWVNEDAYEHTVTPTDKDQWGTEGSGDHISDWMGEGDTYSFTFDEPGTYTYYCIPHAAQADDGEWRGMVATIIVSESAASPGPVAGAGDPGPALPVDVAEIGRDAADVPPPIGDRGPEHLYFDITATEVVGEMADGTTYNYWTFDNTVPGPMLRAKVGDTMTINLTNDPGSSMGHDIDFHAVTGPGGGAPVLGVEPGETVSATFKLLNPGLFIYHCAYQDPPLHIAHGMYGLILVEPEEGLEPVDREYYVVQSDFYSPFDASQEGHHDYDGDRASSEDPSFVVFNGRMGSLQDEDRQLQAEVGETVRLYVGNGGPNLVSSFHVIGEIFDRVWDQGGLGAAPQENIQTTLVPAGGATIVEFDVEVPGDYFLVDHSIFRVHKGAFGVLHVEGEEDPDVYREGA